MKCGRCHVWKPLWTTVFWHFSQQGIQHWSSIHMQVLRQRVNGASSTLVEAVQGTDAVQEDAAQSTTNLPEDFKQGCWMPPVVMALHAQLGRRTGKPSQTQRLRNGKEDLAQSCLQYRITRSSNMVADVSSSSPR